MTTNAKKRRNLKWLDPCALYFFVLVHALPRRCFFHDNNNNTQRKDDGMGESVTAPATQAPVLMPGNLWVLRQPDSPENLRRNRGGGK